VFRKKRWFVRIICGHCGYVLRDWDTGLAGLLAPIGTIVTKEKQCPSCKKQAQWWINAEPLQSRKKLGILER
jgi:ribosomal protein S27AE